MKNTNLLYYRYYLKSEAKAIPPSVIPFFDLTIVFKGKLDYAINGKKIKVGEGDCILMPPQTHRKRFQGDSLTEYASFNFSSDSVPDLPLVVKNCADNKLRHVVYACNEFKDPYESRAKVIIECLINAAVGIIERARDNGKYSEITSQLIAFIHENYREKLSLSSICAHAGYSPTYCDAVFKSDVGRPIVDYLIEYRTSKAKAALIENIYSLKDVAEKTGFDDYNYFSRLFKKRTGLSPAKFRQKFNERK